MGVDDLLREADALLDGIPDDATWYVPCDGCGEFTELRAGDRELIHATQYGMEIDPAFVRFAPRAPRLLRELRNALRAMTGTEDAPDTVAQFREAWKDAMEGRTRPISELWNDFDAPESDEIHDAGGNA